MLTARINLERTNEGDLLLSALVEKSDSYMISINDKSVKLDTQGMADFPVDISKEEEIMFVNVSPQMPITNKAVNARVDVYRKKDNEGITSIVVTIDEPYVVDTDPDTMRLKIVPPEPPVTSGSNGVEVIQEEVIASN